MELTLTLSYCLSPFLVRKKEHGPTVIETDFCSCDNIVQILFCSFLHVMQVKAEIWLLACALQEYRYFVRTNLNYVRGTYINFF